MSLLLFPLHLLIFHSLVQLFQVHDGERPPYDRAPGEHSRDQRGQNPDAHRVLPRQVEARHVRLRPQLGEQPRVVEPLLVVVQSVGLALGQKGTLMSSHWQKSQVRQFSNLLEEQT